MDKDSLFFLIDNSTLDEPNAFLADVLRQANATQPIDDEDREIINEIEKWLKGSETNQE